MGWVGNFKDQKDQVVDGKWHHVVVAAEGKNGTLQYYVDGEPIGKGPLGLNEKPEKDIKDVRLNLGQDGRCDSEFGYFKGLINEFTVYTRLLSDAEVQQKANSDRGLAIDPIHKLPSIWGNLKFQ